jgi:hypothetical protein
VSRGCRQENLSDVDGSDALRNDLRMAVRMATNLSLPRDLVAEIDAVAGRRQRSAFVEDALRRALRRERLRAAMTRAAGALRAEDYPHWATSDDVVAWVRELRAEVTDPGPEADANAA